MRLHNVRFWRPGKLPINDIGPTTTHADNASHPMSRRISGLAKNIYPHRLDAKLLQIASICLLASMMTYLDITIVTVAQHTFIAVFSSTHTLVVWTMTGYTLALATVIPVAGWGADRFGTKRLFIGSLAFFIVGSLLCGSAPDIRLLIAFRVVQGLGGGLLLPLVLTILAREAGPKRLGRVVGLLGIPTVLGSAFGPMLGGWLIDTYGWQWIFWLNLPFGLVAAVVAAIVFPADHPTRSETLDLIGMMLLSPGLAILLYGMSSVPSFDSVADYHVWIPIATGLALIGLFILHTLYRRNHPLIDLRIFKNYVAACANVALFIFAAATSGVALLIPGYFQQVLQQTPLQAGMNLVPRGIGAMVTVLAGGLLMDKYGPGKIMPVGIVLSAGGMGIFAYEVYHQAEYLPSFAIALTMMGLGWGFARVPLSAAAVQTLRSQQIARGSTVVKVNQQIAASAGTALMTLLLSNQFNRLENTSAVDQSLASPGTPTGRSMFIDSSSMAGQSTGLHALTSVMQDISHAYAVVFAVGAVMIALTLIPIMMLSRLDITLSEGRRSAVG